MEVSIHPFFYTKTNVCVDKKKRACLLRVQAAEHALGLHGANKVAVDALAPERELT